VISQKSFAISDISDLLKKKFQFTGKNLFLLLDRLTTSCS
jgi:hypothetical protein